MWQETDVFVVIFICSCISPTFNELFSAYSLKESELESAAATLTDARYMEHLGMERCEVQDFNRYSERALLRPAPSQETPEDDLFVTTL